MWKHFSPPPIDHFSSRFHRIAHAAAAAAAAAKFLLSSTQSQTNDDDDKFLGQFRQQQGGAK